MIRHAAFPAVLLAIISTVACDSDTNKASRMAATGTPARDYREVKYVHTDSAARTARYSCPSCSITFDFAADIGYEQHAPQRFSPMVRDTRGNYWAACTYDDCGVAAYDSTGSFIKAVGRRGSGPTERLWIRRIAARGNEVYLGDFQNGRLAVGDSTFAIVRTIGMRYPASEIAVLPDGRIAAVFPRAVNDVVYGAHLLSASGDYLAPLGGADSSGLREDGYIRGEQQIATSPGGSVLIASEAAYLIRQYVDGRLKRIMTGNTDWFDAYRQSDQSRWPRLRSIAVDQEDRLWVLIGMPNPDFEVNPDSVDSNGMISVSDMHGKIDTIVEVWDLTTGKLLTGTRVDLSLTAFADGSHVYTNADTQTGDIVLRVWKMSVRPE